LEDFFIVTPLSGKRLCPEQSDIYLVAPELAAGVLSYHNHAPQNVIFFNPQRYHHSHSLALETLKGYSFQDTLRICPSKLELEKLVDLANLLAQEHQQAPLDLPAIRKMEKIEYHPEIFNDKTNLPDYICGEPKPQWEPHTYGAHVGWRDVRDFGREEKEGLIPDHESYTLAKHNEYDENLVALRKACAQVFDEAQAKINVLTEKVLGEQEEAKLSLRRLYTQIGNGTFQGHIDLEPSDNPVQQMAELRSQCQDWSFRSEAVSSEVVSVEMADSFIYTGLVMVCHGMREMAKSGNIIPEVIGRRFQELYQEHYERKQLPRG